jgi:peptidoglycan/xylan/chitin deacetylase (PgdA/CDA1 family)
MLIVHTPTRRDAMRRYVCSVVLGDWFGLTWRLEQEPRTDVLICLEGSQYELRLPDVFFGMQESDWLTAKSLPNLPVPYLDVKCLGNDDSKVDLSLPVLYGVGEYGISQTETGITLLLDVLGSIFFLLTGYDELASVERDIHGRFPASASLAMRAGYIDRPLADEYAELMWLAMKQLWPQLERRQNKPQLMLSCDVDQPFDCSLSRVSTLLRACTGDLVKRQAPTAAMRRMLGFFYNRLGDYRFDPCYTFDAYLDLCRVFEITATFYFIPSSSEPNNGCYNITDSHIQRLIRKLSDAGHEIGMHGCYEAYLNPVQTQKHYDQLRNAMDQAGVRRPLRCNRQHYLRWDSRITPSILDRVGFEFDSTGGFADHAGFRFGTSREFTMWDWLHCKQLNIRQRPLIVMDCTLSHSAYMGVGYGELAKNYVTELMGQVRRYEGNFSTLWHNDELSNEEAYSQLYELLNGWTCPSEHNGIPYSHVNHSLNRKAIC